MPVVEFPQFQPMYLARTREAFDHADFVFELKYDGFRALAYVDDGSLLAWSPAGTTSTSRNAPLCDWIGMPSACENAVLDGELACLDGEGRPQFNRLLRRRGEPVFVVFDLLWLNGRDLRRRTLLDRKTALHTLIRKRRKDSLSGSHRRQGRRALLGGLPERSARDRRQVQVGQLLVPIRARAVGSRSRTRRYSQAAGRHEQFTRYRSLCEHWRLTRSADPLIASPVCGAHRKGNPGVISLPGSFPQRTTLPTTQVKPDRMHKLSGFFDFVGLDQGRVSGRKFSEAWGCQSSLPPG
jgi:hypothetical protein